MARKWEVGTLKSQDQSEGMWAKMGTFAVNTRNYTLNLTK